METEKNGSARGHGEIRQNLPGITAFTALSYSEGLFARTPQASGEPCHRKQRA